MSFSGKSPSFNRVRFSPRASDPVNPAEGDLQYADGTARSEGFWVYTNGAWSQITSGAASTSIITGDSSSFEGSVGSWVTYADAAGTQPVDGTGGSPNVTFTRITSGVLNGTGSGRLTKDAANRQGQGASLTVAVPLYLRGLPSMIQFSVNGSAGFDFGTAFDSADPSDVTVYLYDVTNSKLLQPFPYTIMSNGIAQCMVQIPSDCASIRAILHVTTTSTTAWTLDIDDVTLSAALNESVKADSDLQPYTPTYTGFGTVTNSNMFFKKMGDSYWIEGSFTAGTTTAVEARISLPLGSVSTGSSIIPVIRRNGSFAVSVNTAQEGTVLIEPSVSYMTFGIANGGAAEPLTKRNGSTVASSGNKVSIFAIIPIQGFTSGNVTAASANLNAPVVFQAYKNGGAISANTTIPTWTGTNKDTVGAFNATTGVYTVRVPGDYFCSFAFVQTATTTTNLSFLVNGTVKLVSGPPATNGYSQSTGMLIDLKVGDTVTLQISNALTAASINNGTIWDMYKVETSGRVYSTRTCYIKDVKTSGTTGGGFTAASYQKHTLQTITGDTTFASLASDVITLQPGTYKSTIWMNGYRVGTFRARLRNTTASTSAVLSNPAESETVTGAMTHCSGADTFSITTTSTFELQGFCNTTNGTDGYGKAVSSGDSEIYAEVQLEKIL